MDLARRIGSLRECLAEVSADALLVTKISNVAYLTGLVGVFDDHADAACLITADTATVFTNFIYAKPARPALAGGPWAFSEVTGSFFESLAEELRRTASRTVVLEASTPYGRFRFFSEQFEGRVIAEDQWVESVRVVKESDEIGRISAAAELTDAAYAHILEHVSAGRSERDIALDIEVFMRRNGSEGVAFPPIVAAGPNAANPHATATERVLAAGDVVKMDFGARLDGYCSDLTRCVVVGTADARLMEMHAAVLEANETGIGAVRAGRRADEIDEAARAVLRQRGFDKEFGHGLGHGVGIDVHEAPRLGPRSGDSVPAGAVVTVEPGVYVEGFGGVRIEDLVVVTETGCDPLSHAPQELFEV